MLDKYRNRVIKRRTRSLIFTRYSYIINSVRKTLEKYDIQRLPIGTFENILKEVKFTNNDLLIHSESFKALVNFNKTIDIMSMYAKSQGEKSIYKHTITEQTVAEWVAALKASYLKAEEDEKRSND